MQGLGRCWVVLWCVAWVGSASAAPRTTAQAQYEAAVAQRDDGNYQQALALIARGLAVAPRDADLLGLKGALLLELRDYPGALAAYQAYLDVVERSENRRQAQKIVDKLRAVQSTYLDIAVANGPAEIYLDSKTLGVFCTAAPACHQPILPGEYKVIAERPGFRRWTGAITAVNGAPTKLAITLVEKPSLLTVSVAPAGAQVTVDGEAYAAPREVAAGPHQVVVTLAGHAQEQREVVAREGKPIPLELTLTPLEPTRLEPGGADLAVQLERAPAASAVPAAPGALAVAPAMPAPVPGRFTFRRKVALAVGGVGLAALGTGVVLGLQAKQLDVDTYEVCPSPSIACVDAAEANELNRRSRSRAFAANVAYGVAGAAVATAALLWLTGAPESRVTVSPRLGPVAGLDLDVRF